MNADSRIVLDACVLANFALCDLFLTLAETPRLYQPLWNREILAEVQRTQVGKLLWPEELSASWRRAVESAFPEALVTGENPLIAACTNQEKDRSHQRHQRLNSPSGGGRVGAMPGVNRRVDSPGILPCARSNEARSCSVAGSRGTGRASDVLAFWSNCTTVSGILSMFVVALRFDRVTQFPYPVKWDA